MEQSNAKTIGPSVLSSDNFKCKVDEGSKMRANSRNRETNTKEMLKNARIKQKPKQG